MVCLEGAMFFSLFRIEVSLGWRKAGGARTDGASERNVGIAVNNYIIQSIFMQEANHGWRTAFVFAAADSSGLTRMCAAHSMNVRTSVARVYEFLLRLHSEVVAGSNCLNGFCAVSAS